jgi:hypothetical protein
MAAKKILKKKHLEEEEQVKLKELDDQGEYEYITTPPDGGFGWVIAFAAMVFTCSENICIILIYFLKFSYVILFVMVLYLLLVR